MDKKKIFIISGVCILVCALIIGLGNLLYYIGSRNINKDAQNVEIEEESKTKDIENVEYEDIIIYKEDGTKVKLSESKDKPVMLLFWNEENADSIAVLEKVESLYKTYEDKIDFYMISTSKNVESKIKDNLSITIYYDIDGGAQEKYNIKEIPSMIYINNKNEVFNAKSGFTTTDSLEANLEILYDNNNIIVDEW